ncbi:hypothetical protein TNCV_4071731 [Trichonephila clavipes]|uniref:Uncharacterized protein n=1 Tax=Trichonephila clavipes TaxID=2585209 RepID=A0A8X6W821_TRICX|nr:hypothetical protein TNCV_4071731 [Trichonephila clavipes]
MSNRDWLLCPLTTFNKNDRLLWNRKHQSWIPSEWRCVVSSDSLDRVILVESSSREKVEHPCYATEIGGFGYKGILV